MLKYNLLENGLDSLNKAVGYYIRANEKDETRLYKYSILLMCHSVELILKHILEQEHFSLIYKSVDEIGPNAETINFKQSLQRINDICKVDIYVQLEQHIKELVDERNKIQHFKVELDKAKCTKILSGAYGVIKYLLNDTLRININDYSEIISGEVLGELEQIEEIYQELIKDAQKIINSKGYERAEFNYAEGKYVKLPCPDCSEDTVGLTENGAYKCFFCYSEYNSIGDMLECDENSYISSFLINEIIKRRARKYNYTILDCPYCNYDTLVYFEHIDEWTCLQCYSKYETAYCEDCGEHYPDSGRFLVVGGVFDGSKDNDWSYSTICMSCADKDKYDSINTY